MQQINLYRPIFRKQEKKFSAVAMAQAGAVMMAGIAVIYGLLWWQLVSTRDDMRQTDKRHADVAAQLQSVTQKFGSAGPEGMSPTQALEKEVAARRQILQALGQSNLAGNRRGYSDYFMALARQHINGVWITSVSINGAGESIQLKGKTVDAARVPRYVQRLSGESVLAGKEFELFMMTSEGKGTALDFVLQTSNTGAPTTGDAS